MGKIKELSFSGKVKNLIFYKMKDNHYVRTAPVRVRQSKRTKIRSANFGIASTAGKVLRRQLLHLLPFPKDRQMQNAFSGAISKWLGLYSMESLPSSDHLPYISGFQFGKGRELDHRLGVAFTISQPDDSSMEITIPAFIPAKTIIAPKGTVSVDFLLTIAGCVLNTCSPTGNYSTSFHIPYDGNERPAQSILLPFTATAGTLTIVAAALQYTIAEEGSLEISRNPEVLPAAVIKAMYC